MPSTSRIQAALRILQRLGPTDRENGGWHLADPEWATWIQGTDLDARILAKPLADDDALVRRNAALATARLAPEIGIRDDLVPALAENLYHWHHHVRGWSIEALQRLGSPAAKHVALRYLAAARWDPMPKSGDTPTGAPAPKGVVKAVTML